MIIKKNKIIKKKSVMYILKKEKYKLIKIESLTKNDSKNKYKKELIKKDFNINSIN